MSNRLNEAMGESSDRVLFRDRLVSRMKEKNLFPAEVARRANISKHALTSYTSLRSLPSQETLAKLAEVLDCKPTDLVRETASSNSSTFVEVREYNHRPNYKLFIARIPLPSPMAVKMLADLVKFVEENPEPAISDEPPALLPHKSNGRAKTKKKSKRNGKAN